MVKIWLAINRKSGLNYRGKKCRRIMYSLWKTLLNNFDAHQSPGTPGYITNIHLYLLQKFLKKMSDFLLSGLMPSSPFLFFSPTSWSLVSVSLKWQWYGASNHMHNSRRNRTVLQRKQPKSSHSWSVSCEPGINSSAIMFINSFNSNHSYIR